MFRSLQNAFTCTISALKILHDRHFSVTIRLWTDKETEAGELKFLPSLYSVSLKSEQAVLGPDLPRGPMRPQDPGSLSWSVCPLLCCHRGCLHGSCSIRSVWGCLLYLEQFTYIALLSPYETLHFWVNTTETERIFLRFSTCSSRSFLYLFCAMWLTHLNLCAPH